MPPPLRADVPDTKLWHASHLGEDKTFPVRVSGQEPIEGSRVIVCLEDVDRRGLWAGNQGARLIPDEVDVKQVSEGIADEQVFIPAEGGPEDSPPLQTGNGSQSQC